MRNIFVAGKGNWGVKVVSALVRQGRFSGFIDDDLKTSGNQTKYENDIIWITYPPGQRKIRLIENSLLNGFNVIIEKPIEMNADEIGRVKTVIQQTGKQVAVDYQYIFCKKLFIQTKKNIFEKNLTFGGTFFAKSRNKIKLNPKNNLGAHIVAVKYYHFPKLDWSRLEYGYGQNVRFIEINGDGYHNQIDLMQCKCDLLEKFIADFELCISTQTLFRVNFNFALKVEEEDK
jgi:hypothetical protein